MNRTYFVEFGNLNARLLVFVLYARSKIVFFLVRHETKVSNWVHKKLLIFNNKNSQNSHVNPAAVCVTSTLKPRLLPFDWNIQHENGFSACGNWDACVGTLQINQIFIAPLLITSMNHFQTSWVPNVARYLLSDLDIEDECKLLRKWI